jgi:cyclopropane fatty-acyl-phospholipid synthase-like methyltransferase
MIKLMPQNDPFWRRAAGGGRRDGVRDYFKKAAGMDRLKFVLGRILAKLFKKRTENVKSNFTIPDYYWGINQPSNLIDRAIRFYIGQEIIDHHKIDNGYAEEIHKNFWSKTDRYFSETKERTEKAHIPAYQDIAERLIPIVEANHIQIVCEFGAGDGKWLYFLSKRMRNINKFIGVDISKKQTETNQNRYKNITFIQSELVEWAEKHAIPNALYLTCGGVLEYLSEGSVKRLFDLLHNKAKGSVIFLIEPIYGDYDLKTDKTSRIIGKEHSYTHNYIQLLEKSGIIVIHQEEIRSIGMRNLVVFAYIESENGPISTATIR